jgi:hypothetical protein
MSGRVRRHSLVVGERGPEGIDAATSASEGNTSATLHGSAATEENDALALKCIEVLLAREHLFTYPDDYEPPLVDSEQYRRRCLQVQRSVSFVRRLRISEEVAGLSVAFYDRIHSEVLPATLETSITDEVWGAASLALACEARELPAALVVILLAGDDRAKSLRIWEAKQRLRAHLNWRIEMVTPYQYIRAIPRAPTHVRILASGIVTLALTDVQLIRQLPSRIAAAAVAVAFIIFDELHEAVERSMEEQLRVHALERFTPLRTSPRSPGQRETVTTTPAGSCPLMNPQTLDLELMRRLLRIFFFSEAPDIAGGVFSLSSLSETST